MTLRLTACGWGRVKGWALRKFEKMTRLAPLSSNSGLLGCGWINRRLFFFVLKSNISNLYQFQSQNPSATQIEHDFFPKITCKLQCISSLLNENMGIKEGYVTASIKTQTDGQTQPDRDRLSDTDCQTETDCQTDRDRLSDEDRLSDRQRQTVR